MHNIYESGEYLRATGQTWHSEDSPWKAQQIMQIIDNNNLRPNRIAEIGCGAGQVLLELSKHASLRDTEFHGYDISPHAIELCRKIDKVNLKFSCQNFLASDVSAHDKFDILLIIDVFEHVPDYIAFVQQCKAKAIHKIFHIPLDIHVSSILRNSLLRSRNTVGHLHYFTADTAISTLQDAGHKIVDYSYTCGSMGLFRHHPSIKTAIANGPRWLFSKIDLPFTARVFGGYSLLVLTK